MRQRVICAAVSALVVSMSGDARADYLQEVIVQAYRDAQNVCYLYLDPSYCYQQLLEYYQQLQLAANNSGQSGHGEGGGTTQTNTQSNRNPHCTTPAVDDSTAKGTIKKHEGDDATVSAETLKYYGVALDNQKGFVPPNGTNQAVATAGITFAYGVDIPQYFKSGFVAMGVPSSITSHFHDNWFALPIEINVRMGNGEMYHHVSVVKLAVGETGRAWLAAANFNGTVDILTEAESEQLFGIVYEYNRNKIAKWMADDAGYTFDQLPSGTQAALIDYRFKWGNLDKPIRDALAAKDWAALSARLANPPDGKSDQRSRDNSTAVATDLASGSLAYGKNPC